MMKKNQANRIMMKTKIS